MVPLMSITRNFFMGREPQQGWGRSRVWTSTRARPIVAKGGPDRHRSARPAQAVGTLSGGERQCVAIARAFISAPGF